MKKIIMKLGSLLIVLSILIGSMPLAFASEIPTNNVEVTENQSPFASDLSTSITNTSFFSLWEDEQYHTNLDDVILEVRQKFINRDPSFTVNYEITGDISNDMLIALSHQIYYSAIEETDSGICGDYLKFSYAGKANLPIHIETPLFSNTHYIKFTFEIPFFTTKEQEDELTAEIDRVIDGFNFTSETTDRQKIDAIYSYLTHNIVYDYKNLNDEDYKLKFTAYAAMMHKTAVCEGYALLFYRMAKQVGVDARVITGFGGEGRDEKHGWNIVKIGDYYYYVDATWDAERYAYGYYLKGSQDFEGHVNDDTFETQEFKNAYPIAEVGLDTGGYDYIEGNFKYHIANGEAVLLEYLGNEEHAIVPSRVNGIPVVHIESGAFNRPEIYDTDILETITISEGIESLGLKAIEYCYNLKTINLPSTLKMNHTEKQRYSGFTMAPTNCFELEDINVAESSTNLKVVDGILYTYDMTELLKCPDNLERDTIEIPDGVINIGNSAFSSCAKIKSVIMPDSVDFVGYWAFSSAYELENIRISENAKFFGNYAIFYTSIKEIYIPASVIDLLEDAILGEFEKITVEEGNPRYAVENGALYDNLTKTLIEYVLDEREEFVVREGTKYIGNFALENAVNLKKVTLPEGLIEIGQGAFTNCASLTHLEVPQSVTTIDAVALSSCKNLASIIIYENAVELGSTNVDSIFHSADHVTIYTTQDSAICNYAIRNGIEHKLVSEFICHGGHEFEKNFVKEYPHANEFNNKCKHCGCVTASYYIDRISIEYDKVDVVLEYSSVMYTGEKFTPAVISVTYDGVLLDEDDYEVTGYAENINAGVGSGCVILEGKGDYCGGFSKNFDIEKVNLETADIVLSGVENITAYDSDSINKVVSLYANGRKLTLVNNECTEGDYNLLYSDDGSGPSIILIGYGNYTGMITKEIPLNLPAPKNLTVNLYNDFGDATISWDMVERADGYVIYRKVNSEPYQKIAPTEFTSLDVRLAANNTYYFKVVPYYKVNSVIRECKSSAEICISTQAPTPPPAPPAPSAPSKPETLAATSKLTLSINDGYDDIKASWKSVSGANGYYVYYKKSSSKSYTLAGTTSGTSAVIKNLSDGVKYTVKIVAYYTSGSKKVASSKYKTAEIYTLKNLSAPKKVSAALYDYDDAKISWSKVSGASTYKVYYKKANAKKYTLKTTTSSTSYKFTKLTTGTKYTIKIVPCYKVSSKTYEDDSYKTATFYTLKKLGTPKVSKKSSKSVTVSWSNIEGESGYEISASTSKSKTKVAATYKTTKGKSKVVSVKKGKTYYYRVRAFVIVNKKKIYSPWSSIKSYKLK